MPFFSVYDTAAHFRRRERDATHGKGASGGARVVGHLLPVLIGFGLGLQVLPASSGPAVCPSLTGAAQQVCGMAAAIPKARDPPSPSDGDAVRAVAPLSADAFHTVAGDRIGVEPDSFLRQPIAVGPALCFYFGVGDYRCVVTGTVPVVVAAPIVIPQESQVSVEQGCGQSGSGTTRPCSYRIMFVPASASRADPNRGSVAVFRTSNIMAVATGARASGSDGQP